MLCIFWLLRHKSVFLVTCIFSYLFHVYFCKQEMRCCSEDAPRTGEQNVSLSKNTPKNVALNKIFHPDEEALSFIFIEMSGVATVRHSLLSKF